MTNRLAIALAQMNPTVGDIAGNLECHRAMRAAAAAKGADLVVCTELSVCGYPPEDLVLKPSFQAACRAGVEALAAETADGGPAMLVGAPWRENGKLHNAALLLADGVDANNAASLRFHDRLGFERVAHFREVGHKFGHWLDLVFLQRFLDAPGAHRP